MLCGYSLAGFGVLALVAINPQVGPQEDQPATNPLAVHEKEMEERPLDALAIALRAAKILGKDEKRLITFATQVQERNLSQLGFRQVMELAEVVEKKVVNSSAANRIRISWLQQRGFGLSMSEVRELVGPPARTSSQILYRGQLEQWTYERPTNLVLSFIGTKVYRPYLETVH